MLQTTRFQLTTLISLIAVLTLLPFAALANDCDVEQREDGCSDPTGSGAFDNTFRKSCKMHDRCYATEDMSKDKCDSFFEKSMKSACEDLPFYEEPLCKTTANIFYDAVQIGGGPSYDGGQNWSDNHCGTDDDWWSKIYRGRDDRVSCPAGMVIAGRYHLTEATGFSQYFCTAVSATQNRGGWVTVKKGNSFICPNDGILVGMEKKKNGKFGLRCAALSDTMLGPHSWSSQINNSNGTTYYCPNNKVLVGFKKSNTGDVKYACSSV